MLSRYQIIRGKRPPNDPLPDGLRIDIRKHTRHFLRPEAAMVDAFLADPSDVAFARFARAYEKLLAARFAEDHAPFDDLVRTARSADVYLGCNCPTKKNPDVRHCHTTLALAFIKLRYPTLRVVIPR